MFEKYALAEASLLELPLLAPYKHQLQVSETGAGTTAEALLSEKDGVLHLQSLNMPATPPLTSRELVNEWYLRIRSFRGKQEPISKTLGLSKRPLNGVVIDTTAGLGRDSIIMTKLGCQVMMLERELLLACVVQQALEFAKIEPWFQEIPGSCEIHAIEAEHFIQQQSQLPIAAFYCDPMFTHKANKSANNKRLIQALQHLCHQDEQYPLDEFLLQHLKPGQRLVVKRAPHTNPLPQHLNFQIKGKAFRFDIHYRPETQHS